VPQLGARAAYVKQTLRDQLVEHKQYIEKYGEDMPEISGWKWSERGPVSQNAGSTEADNV